LPLVSIVEKQPDGNSGEFFCYAEGWFGVNDEQ
jgi:hypothetical protein